MGKQADDNSGSTETGSTRRKPSTGFETELQSVSAGAETDAFETTKSAFWLPPTRSSSGVISSGEQGWSIDTEVRPSTVEVAGNGRFAVGRLPLPSGGSAAAASSLRPVVSTGKMNTESEDSNNEKSGGSTTRTTKVLPVARAGDVVVEKFCLPMSEVSSLVKDVPNDSMLTFSSVEDLEKYISLAESEGGYTRAQILKVFEHFMIAFDPKMEVVCLNTCTWTVNHADQHGGEQHPPMPLNVEVRECCRRKTAQDGGGSEGGVATTTSRTTTTTTSYQGVATRDINPGDELYMDYRRFLLPDFYTGFRRKYDYNDLRCNTLNAVYGADSPDVCGIPERPWESVKVIT